MTSSIIEVTTNISKKLKYVLRRKSHHLKPIVIIGQKGLTGAVAIEIERALLDHELVKIKLHDHDRNKCKMLIEQICQDRNATLIHTVGHTATIYRKTTSLEKQVDTR